MKKLTCELCGSNDFVKEDGLFVCQSCGTKYSVEEAKKLMIEGVVDVSGSKVQIDKSNEIDNLLIIARRARDEGNYSRAANHFDDILQIEPNSWEANFYRTYCMSFEGRIMDIPNNVHMAVNAAESTLAMLFSEENINEAACIEIVDRMKRLASFALDNYYAVYVKNPEYESIVTGDIHNRGAYTSLQNDCKEIVRIMGEFYSDVGQAKRLTSSICKSLVTAYQALNQDINKIPDDPYVKNEYMQSIHDMYMKTTRGMISYVNQSQEIAKQIGSKLEEIERIAKKVAADVKREVYWSEHQEEKAELESKKEKNISKIQDIEKIIQPHENKIAELNNKKKGDVQSQIEKKSLQSRINKLSEEKNRMSIFKRKEKQMIQDQIDSLSSGMNELNRKIAEERSILEEQINQEIENINELMKPHKESIKELQAEIQEIDNELTKDRS